MGHPGRDRTTSLIIDRFFWSRMRGYIATWIQECDTCLKFKIPVNQRAELQNMESNISPIDDKEESEKDEDESYLIGTGTKPQTSADPREDALNINNTDAHETEASVDDDDDDDDDDDEKC